MAPGIDTNDGFTRVSRRAFAHQNRVKVAWAQQEL